VYLPADDRRHFVAWSNRTKEDFTQDYWASLYKWYADGGVWHVTAYLAEVDLSDFDAKAPPPKTPAFWDVVDSNRAPEDAELADVLDKLDRPSATTLAEIAGRAGAGFADWLRDRKNARQIPHRLETAGYVPVRNPDAKDGLWRVDDRRQAIYARLSSRCETDWLRHGKSCRRDIREIGDVSDVTRLPSPFARALFVGDRSP
jgi:hypothetical protein